MDNNFYIKVVKIQSELSVPKAQRNSFGKYNYRSCEDILAKLKPLLEKYELVQNTTDEILLIGDRYYVKATVRLSNGKEIIESHGYAREASEKKGMDFAQLTGSCSSYARKYALNGLYGIDDTKDQDTDEFVRQSQYKKPYSSNKTYNNEPNYNDSAFFQS